MPCLLVIILLGFPRLALLLILLFTDWLSAGFDTRIWPMMGFVFFPYTTICYLWASIHTHHQINGAWVFLVVLGVLLDLGVLSSARRKRRRRRR